MKLPPSYNLSTHLIHHGEGTDALHAHVQPIYLTSTFSFDDVDVATEVMTGRAPGFSYTRGGNPTVQHLANKYALLEGIDLIRAHPDSDPATLVKAIPFASGMAAISAGILSRVRGGDTVIAQRSLYNTTYQFLTNILPRYNINVVWQDDLSPEAWDAALTANPKTTLIYIESPANPTMIVCDIKAISEVAHRHNAWVITDNTFASPYCQRPLTLGVDLVAHSTTKYLSGHGTHLGGAIISRHVDFVMNDVRAMLRTLGGAPSPMDCWLGNNGIKTFGVRMKQHCANADAVARFLASHPKVKDVRYPGLDSHPQHDIAKKQMIHFGGMLSFELHGGADSAKKLMTHLRLASLAASLGTVDSLIQLSSAMNYSFLDRAAQQKMTITEGLMRYSTGIEDTDDVLDDFEQALASV